MDRGHLCIFVAVALPLIGSPLLALAGQRLGRRVGWLALLFPLLSVGALLALMAGMELPGRAVIEWPWIPSLGINLSFLADGLSLFFALIVSGVGLLIVFYSIFYLDDHYAHHGRFYCYLILFMAAMLGTVLSNNLMLLFVFWELTGLASFLLIGFLHHEEGSRVGARQALLITAFTGLLMLAGIIMIGTVTDEYSLAELLTSGLPFEEHKTWLNVALMLMMLGAFGKSAQFPFHFWLPNAMAAPTPVSAYLHSATMVKLGVFLSARLFPLAVDTEWWAPMLAWVGFTTLVLGAVLALVSHELKAILAYSTVSQLGFLIGYYGLGPTQGVEYDYLHILNHVFYKGCLFMVAGIVIHATGKSDIRELGGLYRRMPILGVVCFVAAATMAGFPLTTGFISKEAMFKEIFVVMGTHGVIGGYACLAVLASSTIKVAFSLRLFASVFLGREPAAVGAHFHAPPMALLLPPAILAMAALAFGIIPTLFDYPFHRLTLVGLNRPPEHLAVWHGWTSELFGSIVVVLLGIALYQIGRMTHWRWHRIPAWLQFDRFFEAGLEVFSKGTKTLTRWMRSDQPTDFLPIIIAFIAALVGGTLFWHYQPMGNLREILGTIGPGDFSPLRTFAAALIALSVIGVVVLKRWTTQLISLAVAGFLLCFYFVLYRAPDLALTQILIEAVTVIMILLLLGRFPKSAEVGERTQQASRARNLVNLLLSLAVGATVTVFILVVTADPHPSRIGQAILEKTVPLAEGSNAVNTVLVDFRGFDTLGEIMVLVIAMLGCLGLLMRYKRSREEYRQGPMGLPGYGTPDNPGEEKT
jgi:NADH:ubiquinone oxidoreductase subunit 5 (subunit L)/multisubunit Na+/H+ antiporter MnhA subunit